MGWVNPDTPRCIGCYSPFQESDLEATNDQKALVLLEGEVLFILTNIC